MQSLFVDGVVFLNTRMCSLKDMKDSDDLQRARINYVGIDDFDLGGGKRVSHWTRALTDCFDPARVGLDYPRRE